VKPGFEQPIDKAVYEKTVEFFEELMQLLHPFMPFITEEIYHQLKEQKDDLTVKQFPIIKPADPTILQNGIRLKADITAIRDARKKNQIKNIEPIKFMADGHTKTFYSGNKSMHHLLQKQTNILLYEPPNEAGAIEYMSNDITVISSYSKFYLHIEGEIDKSIQKEQLQKDLDYLKGFLVSVEKKLSNERFVQQAKPDVIDIERKKKADAEAKIKVIEESLAGLKA
jgi:valyl-tRNA synthetase